MAEQWAEANLGELHLRDGKCFQGKLRQLNGGVEKSIYLYLYNHMTRIKESAVLAAQLAKLDSMLQQTTKEIALEVKALKDPRKATPNEAEAAAIRSGGGSNLSQSELCEEVGGEVQR